MATPLDPILPYLPFVFGIIGAIGVGIALIKFIQGQKDRQIKVHVEKVKGNDHRIRQIRVRYMNKVVKRCNISFNETLLIWDGTDGKFEFTIFEGGAKNATIPDNIFTEEAEIIIKSGKKVIEKTTFKEMELAP